jgi:hypothetical protein
MEKDEVKEITICGEKIKLGDYLKVEYTTGKEFKGSTIKGTVTELWGNGLLQGRLSCGWCFHDHDKILEHTIA